MRLQTPTLTLPMPEAFILGGVATSHGWYALAPYRWDAESGTLHRVEAVPSGMVTRLEVAQDGLLTVRADVELSIPDGAGVTVWLVRGPTVLAELVVFPPRLETNEPPLGQG